MIRIFFKINFNAFLLSRIIKNVLLLALLSLLCFFFDIQLVSLVCSSTNITGFELPWIVMQEASPASAPSAQLVGNAFVEQYYHILHESPQLVHRFYQDSSFLSRADVNGNMATVITMQVSILWYHGNKLLCQVSRLEISLLYGLTWIGQLFFCLWLLCRYIYLGVLFVLHCLNS